jgi:hypothetical protein
MPESSRVKLTLAIPTTFILQKLSKSSQLEIATPGPQSLPPANFAEVVLNRPPGCFCPRFYCLALLIVESPPWRAGPHLATHSFTYPDLLLFFLRNFSIAKQIYLLFIIKFMWTDCTILCAMAFVDSIFKHQLQAPTTRAQVNNVFRILTRSLLPSRWASWGDMRPSSRDLLCCSWPIQRM